MLLQKALSKGLRRSGELLCRVATKLSPPGLPSPRQAAHQEIGEQWFADRGDQTLRLDYDLNENSLVCDLGGYEGQWSSDIFARYCCTIHIFEPVQAFATQIERRFSGNRKIHVHRIGLGNCTGKLSLAVCKDRSSVFRDSATSEEIQLVRAADFLQQISIGKIDLLKINIEGGEYELLEHLIESGLVENIRDIQVQFHDIIPEAERRMNQIQQALARTHALTYQYRFVWENWRRLER
jgi:FkbM family methyltransferase